jgi:hypothetical protein
MLHVLLSFLLCAPAVASRQEAAEPPKVERHRPELAAETALELQAFWEPCKDSLYHLFEETPVLREPHPSELRRSYGAEDFRPFLPREPVALGVPWSVDGEAVLAFLSQFHPGARLRAELGGEVPGTWALLRAAGPEAFEILLRAHAVLQLEDGVVYKPAQFEGRLVLGRDGTLRSFTLALPSRDTNVDVNVPQATKPDEVWVDEHGERVTSTFAADIGWVPRMELTSGAAAAPVWTHAVPDEDARLALRRAFYPFAALDWLPFDEAVLASRERKKPLHLVLLFGCLDDDSC